MSMYTWSFEANPNILAKRWKCLSRQVWRSQQDLLESQVAVCRSRVDEESETDDRWSRGRAGGGWDEGGVGVVECSLNSNCLSRKAARARTELTVSSRVLLSTTIVWAAWHIERRHSLTSVLNWLLSACCIALIRPAMSELSTLCAISTSRWDQTGNEGIKLSQIASKSRNSVPTSRTIRRYLVVADCCTASIKRLIAKSTWVVCT